MSLNVTVVTPFSIACATDRRLSNSKGILSERTRKLVQFDCDGARGLLTYNGIGSSAEGETPNDWISEVLQAGGCDLQTFCHRLKETTEPRIAALAPQSSAP